MPVAQVLVGYASGLGVGRIYSVAEKLGSSFPVQ